MMYTAHIILPVLCFMGILRYSKCQKMCSVTYNKTTGLYNIHDEYINDDWIAKATFTDEIFATGWSYLEVTTSSQDGRYTDEQQAYSAGVVEGYITSDLISKHRRNTVADYCKGEEQYCKRLRRFLEKNLDFIKEMSQTFPSEAYWHQAILILNQISGLDDGYSNITSAPRTKVDVFQSILSNIFGDLEDLEGVLNRTALKKEKVLGSGSCSALIKLLPGNGDLFVSHVTWNSYRSMLRVQKKYDFEFHTGPNTGASVIPGRVATFSSYPGLVFSGDDFYLLSSGLAVLETTLGNENKTLWKYITPSTLLDWMRNIIANRLSQTGEEWTKYFSLFNSGTYNNQWMIVDYKKFNPGQLLADGVIWVLEQLPGYVQRSDVTNVLRSQSYWASYNSPYYPMIFNLSGAPENVEKYGDWFTYDKTPRALIFKRDHVNVVDINSMIKLMRYNDFQHDPLSRCNCTPPYSAENAISARSDLNLPNGTYPFRALEYRSHGGTDVKLTTTKLFKNLMFTAVSGPTSDDVPPFQWSTSGFKDTEPHEGHPDLWKFDPVTHQWNHTL